MTTPRIVSREDWLAARKEFLVKEKEFTRARDTLNAERRTLPMVRIDKEYVFEVPAAKLTLADLIEGRRQLIVQHAMFDPRGTTAARAAGTRSATSATCPTCTASPVTSTAP